MVGRYDCPQRSRIINVGNPATGRIVISLQLSYNLMRWHFSTEPDSDAPRSLDTVMTRTAVDSLCR